MSVSNAKKRITYFDIAKAVAILAVIWGHFLYPVMLQEVYIFHVPLFFMVSGFFLSKKKGVVRFLADKSKQLLLPYLYTSIGMLVVLLITLFINETFYEEGKSIFMRRVFALLYGSGSPYECSMFSVEAAGPIWFLLSLFFGFMIVRLAIDFKWGFLLVIICIAAGIVTSEFVWLPLSIQAGMVDAGYIYAGYLLKCASGYIKERFVSEENKALTICEYILEALIMIGCFVSIYFYLINYKGQLILLSSNVFPNGFVDVGITFAGAIGVLLFCKLILDHIPGIKHAFLYIGKNTLLILCFHSIDTIVIKWDFVISLFPDSQAKALVVVYILKVLLYVVLVVIWNLLAKLINKYINNDKVNI